MRDNDATSPDLIQARVRSGRAQTNINMALGLSARSSVTSGSGGGSVGATIASGGGISSVIGGGGGTGDGSGGGSGGGGDFGPRCFAGDTLVRMIDGSEKAIRDTKLFKDVVGVPTMSGIVPGQIIYRTETMFDTWMQVTFEDGRVVEVRPNHNYRTSGQLYAPVVDLEWVFHLNEDTEWEMCKIVETKMIDKQGELDFYNIGVRHPEHSYIAAGDWVSNLKPDEPALQ